MLTVQSIEDVTEETQETKDETTPVITEEQVAQKRCLTY